MLSPDQLETEKRHYLLLLCLGLAQQQPKDGSAYHHQDWGQMPSLMRRKPCQIALLFFYIEPETVQLTGVWCLCLWEGGSGMGQGICWLPLPAAPIGLERQTATSGSCDRPNLRMTNCPGPPADFPDGLCAKGCQSLMQVKIYRLNKYLLVSCFYVS